MRATDVVVEHVTRHGPMRFDAFVEVALYHPEVGYFATSTEAGRRGDFVTGPEVGPLFGAVVANALDTWWRDLGAPDPFVVVEPGAGRGALAIAVRKAAPACLGALTYVLVERSEGLRSRHGDHLPIEAPSHALLPASHDADGLDVVAGQGSGPRFVSLPDLPAIPVVGVVLANELVDNLVFRVLRRTAGGWDELHVAIGDGDAGLVERFVPCADEAAAAFGSSFPDVAVGGVFPFHEEGQRWLRRAVDLVERGRIVVIDYGEPTTAALAERPARGWLRTFRDHEAGTAPTDSPGTQDITCDVGFDQLTVPAMVPRLRTQAQFLVAHGIDVLVDEGRHVWEARAHVGDLAAVAGRSRIREAQALLDPRGLGGFLVAEWVR